ncbi:hypothetical protein [uncultured Bacteroides sp.]|uniref:hypothetical protein n=1 Tax=uncultured Bacteroides sp. TaxID=162156 RepID=UPI003747E2A3
MAGYSSYNDNRFTNRGNIIMPGVRYKYQSNKPNRSIKKLENDDKGFKLICE